MDWKDRQKNDKYVKCRNEINVLSRAYFKIAEIDERFRLFNSKSQVIVELGAAPGGWTQYLLPKVKKIYAYDLLPLQIRSEKIEFHQESLFHIDKLPNCHVVLSDIAPNLSGNKCVDKYAMESIIDHIFQILPKKVLLVCKLFETNIDYFLEKRNRIKSYKFFKPPASRKESTEIYVVARL